jgi:hypothetical protein
MNKNNKERRRVARVVQANNNLWVDAVESQIKRPRRGWDGGRRNKDTKHQKKKGVPRRMCFLWWNMNGLER